MRYVLPLWLILTAFAAPVAAQSGAPAGAESEEIIVKGVKARNREIERFVGALTEAPIGGQLSRFDWAVCPAAVGLSPAQNALIVDRIRRVAEAAGAPLGKADCRPNALLIVAPDKDELIGMMRQKYPTYFRDPIGQQIKLPKDAGPATAWHVEARLTEDDLPANVTRDSMGGKYYSSTTTTSSRLRPATRPHFAGGVLVVERDSLLGLSTVQVADYAAMRLLARTDPQRLERTAAPSILSVIDAPMGSAVPLTMTDWDFGFLKALYGSREHRFANQQRGEMQRILRNDLQQPDSK